MSIRNNKKIIFGALSAVVASVAAGVLVKNNIDKKASNQGEKKKEKKSKNVYNLETRCRNGPNRK